MEQLLQDMLTKHAEKIDFFLIGKTILEIVIFFFVLKFVNKGLHLFFDKLISKVEDSESRKNYYTLRQLGIYVIDAIIILFFATNVLANFGIDTKAIFATAGVIGVAVGFGGKKLVEDLFTGLSIILTGQLRVGDYVTVNDSTGTVEKLTLTMCVIRAFNGDVHYLRNGQIDTVINQTKDFSY
ncbi:MAG: mechanosensitive ion channel, partial [Candidatus Gastranaerophilales bacterium]|nr:mechanosensitive ion channel [Candidatus Gastranaerophilales bacterium]